MRLILHLVIGSVLIQGCQKANFTEIENDFISEYQKVSDAAFSLENSGSGTSSIHPKLEKIVNTPGSFNYAFDSLSNYISIVQSTDCMLRIFSWDDLTGGTSRNMAAIAQYKTRTGDVKTQWLGINKEVIYEMHDILIKGKPHYLCFGSGTYGGGMQHKAIHVLYIEKDTVKINKDCIDERSSIIYAPRNEKIELEFEAVEGIVYRTERRKCFLNVEGWDVCIVNY